MAPSPLNTLLENAPVLSEAPWYKPVDCVLLRILPVILTLTAIAIVVVRNFTSVRAVVVIWFVKSSTRRRAASLLEGHCFFPERRAGTREVGADYAGNSKVCGRSNESVAIRPEAWGGGRGGSPLEGIAVLERPPLFLTD